MYNDLRRQTATAFAVRLLIVAVRSFRGRSTDRIVAVQSQYTRATSDRVQTECYSSATMDDRTATTVRAVRAQTDSRPIALRSKSRRKEFWTVQNSSATYLQRPYGDQCDRPRLQCDCTGTLLRSAAIWSENWSQYGRSFGV